MIFVLLALVFVLAVAVALWLRAEDLSAFDKGYPAPIAGSPPSQTLDVAVQSVEAFTSATSGVPPGRRRIATLRQALDNLGAGRTYSARFCPPTQPGAPTGEWVLAANSDPDKRLLYVHGGGFVAGSPRSHRSITNALAELTGMSVFSLDYRLVPEHRRMAGLDDTVGAFQWLAGQGPETATTARFLAIAGDSAGGNLALSAVQQLRDRGLRNADAVVALCPSTDATMSSPSVRFNRTVDLMLGKSLAPLVAMPAPLRHLLLTLLGRRPPAHPALSPLRGNLQALPPTLLQVSLTEMLLDDAARYFHRARAVHGNVTLETFDNMVHVWHMFYPELEEAQIALARIQDFLARCESSCGSPLSGGVEVV